MENFSRSLSKKVSNGNGNGNGFAAKTVYDDVFGGPPKFGVPTFSPRIEDYSEIFGGFHASRASSIPVLDLPVLDEAEVSFDVQSSKFDYLDVFGGFNGFDFAVSYEELFDQSKGGDESSEEAWTLAETESLSEEMDPSVYYGKNQSLSNGDCPQSFDGIKQFNVPYHKANQRSQEDMSNGTHMTQLHDAPGFTFAVDGITSLQKTEYENLSLQVTDDINLSMDFSEGKIRGKHLRKTMSRPSNTGAGIHSFGKDIKPQRGYDQNGSHSNEMFISVSEIGLRTQPSQLPPPARPPPVVDVWKGDSSGLALNLKVTRNHTFEGTAGDSSPPFFDVEVDASSSAAASAAAMKEAVEKAQAKLKSAKELMVRRKEGLQSRVKLGSKNDVKDRETKGGKVVDGSDNLKDERLKGTCERIDDGMKFFVGQERQTVGKISQVVSDSSTEGDNSFNVAKKSAEKKHGKGSWSSQESCKTDGAGEWKEATEFFELVSTDKSRKALQQANSEKILVQNTKTQEHGQKERKATVEAFEQQEENDKKIKAATEAREKKENEKKSKAAKDARKIEEREKKLSVAQEVCKQEVDEKKLRVAHDLEVSENKLTEADEREEDAILIEVQQKENEVAVKESMKHKETEQKLKDANERMANKKRLTEAHKREENEQRLKETLEREEYEKILKDALERAENEKRLKQALKKEENEKRLKEVLDQEEVEKKQKEAREREENEKRLKEAREREENKKRLKEALEREDNEKKQREALEREENERKLRDAREREENEKKLREALQQEENEKRLKEALEKEENEKKQKVAHERVENEKRLREACEREEVEKRLKEACEREENKKRLEEAHEREENENRIKEVVDWEEIEEEIEEETEERSRQSSKWEECENRSKDAGEGEKRGLHKACEETVRDENEKKQKLAQGTYVHIEGENLKAPDEVCKLNENKNFRATQVACKHEENSVKLETTQEVLAEKNEKIRARPRHSEKEVEAVEKANVLVGDRSKAFSLAQDDLQLEEVQIRIEEAIKSLHFSENVQKSGEAVFGIGQTLVEKNIEVSQMAFDPKNMEKKLTHEWGERGKNINHTQVAFDQEENKDKFMSTQVVNEGERKMETAQLAMSEAKGNTQKIAHQVNTSQRAERKEKNLSETLTLEEREKEERMKRERELEKDRLRKLEEEREREREREKDRMAVERATRDARERAYADARERAERAAVERATAEVRQRALAEARERLEKACAEAREKTLTEKASTEARLRAERAAVERATAEARERAFEKAMTEKPGFEARERVERSASSSVSRFPYSVYGASYNTEKFEGVEGESAQRCKARLERYRRTAERAAKALAEKNMRDLQAQREQAERNRLSESLDADVKRWSSGKEGNLRALLSTLQYILGSDSGWQPIPLTDVITSAAVKKAYRKATLCVHPDKLQQRGASIQQKYICEKVFDLLKEAWNKFNSEER